MPLTSHHRPTLFKSSKSHPKRFYMVCWTLLERSCHLQLSYVYNLIFAPDFFAHISVYSSQFFCVLCFNYFVISPSLVWCRFRVGPPKIVLHKDNLWFPRTYTRPPKIRKFIYNIYLIDGRTDCVIAPPCNYFYRFDIRPDCTIIYSVR